MDLEVLFFTENLLFDQIAFHEFYWKLFSPEASSYSTFILSKKLLKIYVYQHLGYDIYSQEQDRIISGLWALEPNIFQPFGPWNPRCFSLRSSGLKMLESGNFKSTLARDSP